MPITPTPPASIADFKAQYIRGFNYGSGPDSVMDSDIASAIILATAMWNPALWNTTEAKPIFCLVVAHFLVVSVQAVGGLNGINTKAPGQYSAGVHNTDSGAPIGSKTVDKVTVTYAGLEKLIEKWPMLATFRGTGFGAQYATLVAPRLVGRANYVPNQQDPGAVVPAVPFLI